MDHRLDWPHHKRIDTCVHVYTVFYTEQTIIVMTGAGISTGMYDAFIVGGFGDILKAFPSSYSCPQSGNIWGQG